jgi:hypothetical protein
VQDENIVPFAEAMQTAQSEIRLSPCFVMRQVDDRLNVHFAQHIVNSRLTEIKPKVAASFRNSEPFQLQPARDCKAK